MFSPGYGKRITDKCSTIFLPISMIIIFSVMFFVLSYGCIGIAAAQDDTTPVAFTANTLQDTVYALDMNNNSIIANITGFDSPAGIAFSPANNRLYVTNGGDNTVTVIDIVTFKPIATITVGNMPYGIALSPDGTIAYVANNEDNTVSFIDTAANKVNRTVNVGNGPYGIKVNPNNGDVYVINSNDNTMSIIRGNGVAATIPIGKYSTRGLAVTPDGTLLLVVDMNNNSVSIINTTTYKTINTVNTGKSPDGIAISPNGNYAYVANLDDRNISILQLSDNSIRVSLNASDPSMIGFRPDGKMIYVTSASAGNKPGNITVMDSASGETKAGFNFKAFDIDTAEVSSQALIDKTPPVTTLNLYGTNDTDGRFKSDVTCNLTAVDRPSGVEVKNIIYSLNGVNWMQYEGNFTFRGPGDYPVYYRSIDNAGNIEPIRGKVVVISRQTATQAPAPSPTPRWVSGVPFIPATPVPSTVSTIASANASATPMPTSGFEITLTAICLLGAAYALRKK